MLQLCFARVLKRFILSAHLIQVKLLYSLSISMADYVQFLSENRLNRCQIFGRVGFSKTESELHFGFLHIPNIYM